MLICGLLPARVTLRTEMSVEALRVLCLPARLVTMFDPATTRLPGIVTKPLYSTDMRLSARVALYAAPTVPLFDKQM